MFLILVTVGKRMVDGLKRRTKSLCKAKFKGTFELQKRMLMIVRADVSNK